MWTVVWLKRIISTLRPVCKKVTVSGKQVKQSSEKYFLLNKPAGVVSAVSDKEHQTVIDLIKEAESKYNKTDYEPEVWNAFQKRNRKSSCSFR